MTTHTITLDWLAGTVSTEPTLLMRRLEEYFGGHRQPGRAQNGYSNALDIVAGDQKHCTVMFRPDDPPWVCASGGRSQALQSFLHQSGFDWYVTRMDAALDVFDAALFPVLVDAAKKIAAERDMVTNVAGDWIGCSRGRTFYLGSRSSRCFHRIYEKGRKERTDHNWLRVELEYKPQSKEDRFAATVLTAPQVWAMHAGPIFGPCLGLDLAEVFNETPGSPRRERDYDRACRALAAQYGRTIERWLTDTGGDAQAFVAELLAAVEHQRCVRKWEDAPDMHLAELENPT
jgi:rhodanese-related sulfurtransferase